MHGEVEAVIKLDTELQMDVTTAVESDGGRYTNITDIVGRVKA